jgi:hypothetical protein
MLCLNDKHPWTMAQWSVLHDQFGPVTFRLSIFRIGPQKDTVNGTLVLLILTIGGLFGQSN